jgi:hypothetical protein
VLLNGLLSLSLVAAPAAERSYSAQVLHDQCLMSAADPKNPWALAHGITALGANFVASDGRKASDVMIHDFLLRNALPDGGPGPGANLGFLKYAKDGTPIEPHSNLITKTLLLAGVPLTAKFQAGFGPVTLGQMVDELKRGFRHVPSSEEYWKDVAWTLDALSQVEDPGNAVFKDDEGHDVDFNKVMDDALSELEKETAELKEGMEKHFPLVAKRKQGIYVHSCGGLHFVQAVLGWARHPAVRKKWGARVDKQIAILLYRLDSERQQYDAALQQGGPQYRLQLLTQMLKFYGHFLETTARLKTDLNWKPDAAQTQTIAKAKAYLDNAVRQLDGDKTFAKMADVKEKQPQVFLDLIGDSCHASHGLDGWK